LGARGRVIAGTAHHLVVERSTIFKGTDHRFAASCPRLCRRIFLQFTQFLTIPYDMGGLSLIASSESIKNSDGLSYHIFMCWTCSLWGLTIIVIPVDSPLDFPHLVQYKAPRYQYKIRYKFYYKSLNISCLHICSLNLINILKGAKQRVRYGLQPTISLFIIVIDGGLYHLLDITIKLRLCHKLIILL